MLIQRNNSFSSLVSQRKTDQISDNFKQAQESKEDVEQFIEALLGPNIAPLHFEEVLGFIRKFLLIDLSEYIGARFEFEKFKKDHPSVNSGAVEFSPENNPLDAEYRRLGANVENKKRIIYWRVDNILDQIESGKTIPYEYRSESGPIHTQFGKKEIERHAEVTRHELWTLISNYYLLPIADSAVDLKLGRYKPLDKTRYLPNDFVNKYPGWDAKIRSDAEQLLKSKMPERKPLAK